MESLILLLFLIGDAALIPSVMYFFPLKQQDCFLLVVIIVGNWKLFILPFHQHPFCFTHQSVLLFLKVDSACSFQAILFFFLACISLFNERDKTKQRFDRCLERFYSSVAYSIGFVLFFSFLLVSVVFTRYLFLFLLFRIPKCLHPFKLAVSWCWLWQTSLDDRRLQHVLLCVVIKYICFVSLCDQKHTKLQDLQGWSTCKVGDRGCHNS